MAPEVDPSSSTSFVSNAATASHVANCVGQDAVGANFEWVLAALDQPVPGGPGRGADVGNGFVAVRGPEIAEREASRFFEPGEQGLELLLKIKHGYGAIS